MTNNFNLSEHILNLEMFNEINDDALEGEFIYVDKIKEFIKQLKEILKEGKTKDAWDCDIIEGDWNGLMSKINKLAGDELKNE